MTEPVLLTDSSGCSLLFLSSVSTLSLTERRRLVGLNFGGFSLSSFGSEGGGELGGLGRSPIDSKRGKKRKASKRIVTAAVRQWVKNVTLSYQGQEA